METSEELASCEFCSLTGPRESFYSNSKRFCSAACSHSFSAKHRFRAISTKTKNKPHNFLLPSETERHQCISMGFDWGAYLISKKAEAATVELFQHSPMAAHWGEIGSGMKVEVLNLDCSLNTKVFWIASVVQVAGYKAKLRYEGFGDDSTCDFWCNLCTLDVHAVGWCATIGKPLVPPQTIQHKYSNWKSFLVKRLTGAKTLPHDFQKRVMDSVKSPFLCNMRLEVVDKTRISRMRVGVIEEIIGGRLRLRYEDSDYENDDFWCHAQSTLIHPVGWSEKVSHKILVANKDYKLKKGFKNARQELFAPVKQVKSCGFKVGMKLEAIDPLNLSAICVATVKKVLKNGYLMIGIDGSEAADGSDWFCYHCTAPSIFPVGFCMENGISLSVPKAYKENFSWKFYLRETNSQAASVEYFESELPNHGFKHGMKLEAVDLMEPRLICVATVTRVIGRLLHVHFDGWENQYDQWVDCHSPDIYPVGWCELVGYELQPPPNLQPTDAGTSKKKKLKGQSFVTKKKRKKSLGQRKQPNVAEVETDDKDQLTESTTEIMETDSTPAPSAENENTVVLDEAASKSSEPVVTSSEIPKPETLEGGEIKLEEKEKMEEVQAEMETESHELTETSSLEPVGKDEETLPESNAELNETNPTSATEEELLSKTDETENPESSPKKDGTEIPETQESKLQQPENAEIQPGGTEDEEKGEEKEEITMKSPEGSQTPKKDEETPDVQEIQDDTGVKEEVLEEGNKEEGAELPGKLEPETKLHETGDGDDQTQDLDTQKEYVDDVLEKMDTSLPEQAQEPNETKTKTEITEESCETEKPEGCEESPGNIERVEKTEEEKTSKMSPEETETKDLMQIEVPATEEKIAVETKEQTLTDTKETAESS